MDSMLAWADRQRGGTYPITTTVGTLLALFCSAISRISLECKMLNMRMHEGSFVDHSIGCRRVEQVILFKMVG